MDQKYIELFDKIETILIKQKNQKLRGLNDYNLLNTVLRPHDEVRLHSRMIASLLDPNGKHYQGSLFLEVFIRILGLDNFGLNLQNTKVYVEYKDIDIYLTDGIKHILLENKIWAGDQPCQIIKYINIIQNEYSLGLRKGTYPWEGETLDILENMKVVYLTPNSKPCSDQHSIHNGCVFFSGTKQELNDCSDRMKNTGTINFDMKNYQADFIKITYKNEIISWLTKSRDEIRNITNLNESIGQYIDIVNMINNDYKGNVMTITDELMDPSNQEYFKVALKLDKEMKQVKGEILFTFFESVVQELTSNSNYGDVTNQIEPKKRIFDLSKCNDFFDKKANFFGVFIDCDFGNNLYLYISVLYSDLYYGVVQCNQYEIVPMDENIPLEALLTYTKWNELTWYSKSNKKIDMTDLSNDEVLEILTNFEKSSIKTEILDMVNEAKNLI